MPLFARLSTALLSVPEPYWVRQNALAMYYSIIFGRLTTVDQDITARIDDARCISLLNCADPDLLTYMQYNIDQCDASRGDTYQLAKQFGRQLIDNTREVIGTWCTQTASHKIALMRNFR
jgi:hypothetical protein